MGNGQGFSSGWAPCRSSCGQPVCIVYGNSGSAGLRAMMGYRSSRRLMSESLGSRLVAIDRTQSLIYAGGCSNRLLEGLLCIVAPSLTNLARSICVYQGY